MTGPDDPRDPAHASEATRIVAPGAAGNGSPVSDQGVLANGTRLAEFEITRLIGQGGFGVVYEAWDHTLERSVAIKEYLPSSLAKRLPDGTIAPLSEQNRETFDLGMRSFTNEARLLAQFNHPALLKVYRFWSEHGTTYMVMPYLHGHTLREILSSRREGVDEAWLLKIVDGVTLALAVMHAANCYHRDIAPDNIMVLDGSEDPVVLDFGAARRVISDKTQAITVILKPGYAPVEQYAEMPDMAQGAWTDVYALAAVMHLAVSGRVPPTSVGRLLSDTYAPLAGNEELQQRYSARLLAAIDQGLAVRPKDRPQDMHAFRALLGLDSTAGANSAAEVVTAAAASGAVPAARPQPEAPRSRPLLAVIGVALLVLVLAGGAAWWWLSADERGAGSETVAAKDEPAVPPPSATPPAAPAGSDQRPEAHAPDADDPMPDTPVARAPEETLPEPSPRLPEVILPGLSPGDMVPPEPRPDAVPESRLEAEDQPAPEAEPELKPEPELEAEPEPEPELEPEPEPVEPEVITTPIMGPRTAEQSLAALQILASDRFQVSAQTPRSQVRIGTDMLDFEIQSNRDGHVYVFMLASQGELFLLFPNALDKRNQIQAGKTMRLPRDSWPMQAGGPPGLDRFAVIVSQQERDFSQSGVLNAGVFVQFPTSVLAALERAREGEQTPLAGHVVCSEQQVCEDAYGVAYFNIEER